VPVSVGSHLVIDDQGDSRGTKGGGRDLSSCCTDAARPDGMPEMGVPMRQMQR
jgi:hypothetical protein